MHYYTIYLRIFRRVTVLVFAVDFVMFVRHYAYTLSQYLGQGRLSRSPGQGQGHTDVTKYAHADGDFGTGSIDIFTLNYIFHFLPQQNYVTFVSTLSQIRLSSVCRL